MRGHKSGRLVHIMEHFPFGMLDVFRLYHHLKELLKYGQLSLQKSAYRTEIDRLVTCGFGGQNQTMRRFWLYSIQFVDHFRERQIAANVGVEHKNACGVVAENFVFEPEQAAGRALRLFFLEVRDGNVIFAFAFIDEFHELLGRVESD